MYSTVAAASQGTQHQLVSIQQSSTFVAPETSFVEDNFSMDRRCGCLDDSSAFNSIIITSAPPQIIRHQIAEVVDPCCIPRFKGAEVGRKDREIKSEGQAT